MSPTQGATAPRAQQHQSTCSPFLPSIDHISTLSPSTLTGSPAWSVSFSVDGKYLAACFGNPGTHVKVWEHRIAPRRYDNSNACRDGSSSPSVEVEAAVSSEVTSRKMQEKEDCIRKEWKLMATINEEHTRTIRSVAFAPTPSALGVPILATASFDGKVLIWEHYPDSSSNDNFNDQHDQESVNSISNGRFLLENINDNLETTNNCAFEPIAQLEGHDNEIKCLAWNATGSLLASCGRDKTIWIWECFLPHTIGGSESMAFSDNGEDSQNGQFECFAVLQGHEGDVKSIAFGPSHSQWGEGEEVLYSVSYDNTIRVWAEECGDWYCAATLGGVESLVVHPMSSSTTVPEKGAVHTSTVWCLGLTPGGVRMFTGSEDGSMAIWKMHTAAERKRMFSQAPNKSSTDGLWNCVGRLPDAHSSYAVLSVDCAPSCAGHGRIASSGGDNCINIYREEMTMAGTSSGVDLPKFAIEALVVDAHDGDVNCVKWHPRDGTCLVSCGDDGAVKVWRYLRG